MGGGLESRCVGRVYGEDGVVHHSHRTTAALKTTTHPKTRYRKPYAATQHPMLLMMGVCLRNMSSLCTVCQHIHTYKTVGHSNT